MRASKRRLTTVEVSSSTMTAGPGIEGAGPQIAALVDRHLDELAGFGVEDRARARGLAAYGAREPARRSQLSAGTGAESSITQLRISTSTPGMTRL